LGQAKREAVCAAVLTKKNKTVCFHEESLLRHLLFSVHQCVFSSPYNSGHLHSAHIVQTRSDVLGAFR